MNTGTTVYIVIYEVHRDILPTVTVFDNEKSAQEMFDYIKGQGFYVWMAELPLYHKYIKK